MRRLTAVFAVALQGCSFAFVSGPPANHAQLPTFDCSTSNFAPILDTVFAVLEGANLVLAAKDNDTQWHDIYCASGDTTCNAPISHGAAIPLYLALAAVGAAGAYYGYTRVGQCKDAKSQLMVRQMTQPQIQGTWPPPAPGTYPPPAPGTYPPPGTYPAPAPGTYPPPGPGAPAPAPPIAPAPPPPPAQP